MEATNGQNDDLPSVGETWHGVANERRIALITQNANGTKLIGYQGDHGTGLVTEPEFKAWVRDEVATPE